MTTLGLARGPRYIYPALNGQIYGLLEIVVQIIANQVHSWCNIPLEYCNIYQYVHVFRYYCNKDILEFQGIFPSKVRKCMVYHVEAENSAIEPTLVQYVAGILSFTPLFLSIQGDLQLEYP